MFRLDGKIALVTGKRRRVGPWASCAHWRPGGACRGQRPGRRAGRSHGGKFGAETGLRPPPRRSTSPPATAVAETIARVSRDVGPIAILINNAGNSGGHVFQQKPFAELLPEQWQPFIDVNLMGVLHCTRAVIGGMSERRWGRVITISSTAGRLARRSMSRSTARPRPARRISCGICRKRWRATADRQRHCAGLHEHGERGVQPRHGAHDPGRPGRHRGRCRRRRRLSGVGGSGLGHRRDPGGGWRLDAF